MRGVLWPFAGTPSHSRLAQLYSLASAGLRRHTAQAVCRNRTELTTSIVDSSAFRVGHRSPAHGSRNKLTGRCPIKHKIKVIHGLFNKPATGQGIHPAQTGALLSGARIQKGAIIRAGITIDQVIANRVGQETAQSSIVLACEQPMTGYHETNFSMAYSSHISWQSPDSPVPNEVYPSASTTTVPVLGR